MRLNRRDLWLLVLTDLVLINIALVGAFWMRYELRWFAEVGFDAELGDYLTFAVILSILLPITFKLDGAYNTRRDQSWFDQMYAIVNATAKYVNSSYSVLFGERGHYQQHYNEIKLNLSENTISNRSLSLVFRVYDEGASFRYVIPDQSSLKNKVISSEYTRFRFDSNYNGWVEYADFNSKIERERCFRASLKAYFQMIKKMM